MICRIGVDESGKGDYFGYLIIAGVLVDDISEKKLMEMGVKDSKRLSDFAVPKLAANIRKMCRHEIVAISPEKYNLLQKKIGNLNKILAWGHARVIENMLEKNECELVITDKFGDEKFLKDALMERGKKIKVVQKINGEREVAVAAASVLARAEFLRTLKKLSLEIGYKLPKGATHVDEAAKAVVRMHGLESLRFVAKMHFKVTKKIITKVNSNDNKGKGSA